jgi:uncharacterized protein (TIGR02452 family)
MFARQDTALRHALVASECHPEFHTRRLTYDASFAIPSGAFQTKVTVQNKDAIDVALELHDPLVLILADAHVPGGCVLGGGNMQEESLFRRTTLFASLKPALYPIGSQEALYARGVGVLFDGAYEPTNPGTTLSFIACPGIKLPMLIYERTHCKEWLSSDDEAILRCKVRLILQAAIMEGHTHLVAGALGCGVWGCPVEHVAEVFGDVIAHEYSGVLKSVTFAILGAMSGRFRSALHDAMDT